MNPALTILQQTCRPPASKSTGSGTDLLIKKLKPLMPVFPASVKENPLAVSLLPTSRNPNSMWTGWARPISVHPNISMRPRSPVVTSRYPNPTSVRRSCSNHFSPRRWRANSYTETDVQLAERWSCGHQYSR